MPIEVMTRVDLGVALRAALDGLTQRHPDTSVAWISSVDDLSAAREGVAAGRWLVAVLQNPQAVNGEAAAALEADRPEGGPAPLWIWWDRGEGSNDEGTNDEGTNDEGTNDEGTNGEETSGEGTNGEGTNGEGTNGEGTNDEGGTSGEGTNGEGTNGEGTRREGTPGEGTPGEGTRLVPAWMLDAPSGASPPPLLEPADDRDLAAMLSSLAAAPTGARILLRNRRALRAHSATARPPLERGTVLIDGAAACVLATGAQVGEALAAAMDLQIQSIDLRVVRLPSIRPLDEALVRECAQRPGPLLVAEPGGAPRPILAEAVEALLGASIPVVRVSARPTPPNGEGGGSGAEDDPLAEERPETGPAASDIRVAVTREVRESLREREQDGRDA